MAGLDDGADDYLVKPFAFAELLGPGRVAAAPGRRHATPCSAVGRPRARHGPPSVALRPGRAIELTTKEFALLRYFMTHAGRGPVARRRLLEHVWDEYADPFTNTVRVTVGTLRRKLAAAARAPLDRDRDRGAATGWSSLPADGTRLMPRSGRRVDPVLRLSLAYALAVSPRSGADPFVAAVYSPGSSTS